MHVALDRVNVYLHSVQLVIKFTHLRQVSTQGEQAGVVELGSMAVPEGQVQFPSSFGTAG